MEWLKSTRLFQAVRDRVRFQGEDPASYEDCFVEPVDATHVVVGSGPFLTRCVVLSDTHAELDVDSVPDGDILFHCGDFCNWGSPIEEAEAFNELMGRLPHKLKVVIAGNHETCFKGCSRAEIARVLSNCTYLQDELLDLGGATIYGTPWTHARSFWYHGNAFSAPPDELERRFGAIPSCDILMSHVPPLSIMDAAQGIHVGSVALRRNVLERVRPTVHLFGHNHDEAGMRRTEEVLFINAAQKLHRQPMTFDLHTKDEIVIPSA